MANCRVLKIERKTINMEEKNKEKTNKLKNIRHTIVVYLTIAVTTIVALTVLYTQVLINAYIPSESMETTLMIGDMVIGNRLAYKFGNTPERFDISIFYAPDKENSLYIKRIIGMPGEKVTIKDGNVYINDNPKPLDDSFIREKMEVEPDAEFNVPEDCYFMLGDNRNNSLDSRYWDNPYVSSDKIVAKACFKYWKGFKLLH